MADVIIAGDTAVDLTVDLQHLADRDVRNVLAEGGLRVSAQLAAAGLLDELCLIRAPQLVAGSAPRILSGPELHQPAAANSEPQHLRRTHRLAHRATTAAA